MLNEEFTAYTTAAVQVTHLLPISYPNYDQDYCMSWVSRKANYCALSTTYVGANSAWRQWVKCDLDGVLTTNMNGETLELCFFSLGH